MPGPRSRLLPELPGRPLLLPGTPVPGSDEASLARDRRSFLKIAPGGATARARGPRRIPRPYAGGLCDNLLADGIAPRIAMLLLQAALPGLFEWIGAFRRRTTSRCKCSSQMSRSDVLNAGLRPAPR